MTGVVKDVMGEPLIGANVVEKGRSTNGVITDFNGKFTLEVDESASLVVSYIGYLAQDIRQKGRETFILLLFMACLKPLAIIIKGGLPGSLLSAIPSDAQQTAIGRMASLSPV